MAKIRGIQIKNLREETDHEGCAMFSGDIWYQGKKLGSWSQSYMCGPDNYDFDESALEKEATEYAKTDAVEDMYKSVYNLDCLLSDLVKLMGYEKSYKSVLRKGYKTYILVTDGYHEFGLMTTVTNKEENLTAYSKQIEDMKSKCYKNKTAKVLVFTSKDDFVKN